MTLPLLSTDQVLDDAITLTEAGVARGAELRVQGPQGEELKEASLKHLHSVFDTMDSSSKGLVNRREMIIALRKSSEIRRVLHLPPEILPGTPNHAALEDFFRSLDTGEDEISWEEFESSTLAYGVRDASRKEGALHEERR